jgi:CheY-like chemotaxis protein
LRFSITDTGIGIPLAKQAAIFEPFAQADGSTTRHFGGTGLGLSISSRLAEMMSGRISVDSRVGQGSVFHFDAHFALTRPDEPAFRDTSLAGVTALVVDTSATGRGIVEGILRQWDIIPVLAAGAGPALALIEEGGKRYELMIVDCDSAGTAGGLELLEEIASDPEFADTPVVMMSYSDQRSAMARLRPGGRTEPVKKPVLEKALLAAIHEAMRRGPVAAPPPVRNEISVQAPQGLRILLAEDNLVNQKIAIRLLSSQGHSVTIADDGRKALAALDAESFDIVLMDVQMPVMDGFEAVAEIRKREKATGGHVTVIAMTAHTLKGDRERCLAAGMDGYVSKPIDKRQLFEVLDSLAPQPLSSLQ